MFRCEYNNSSFLGESFNDYQDFITKKPEYSKEVDNYNSFLDDIGKECAYLRNIDFFCFLNGLILTVFKRELNGPIKFVLNYKLEGQNVMQTMCDILNIHDGESRMIVSTISNNYHFIMPKEFFKVILMFNRLKDQGIEAYRTFKITSKNGKIRDVTAPEDSLKDVLRECNGLLQKIFDKKNIGFQVAYKKDKSIVDNARIHQNHKFVFNMDLKNFFPSCKKELVKDAISFLFESLYNSEVIMEKFLESILLNDALFIGSPVSGCLANTIISRPVKYIKNMAEKNGASVSVYADDITISSDRKINKLYAENVLIQGFVAYGMSDDFKANAKKSLGCSGSRRSVTGVKINDDNKLAVNRNLYRILRASIHNMSLGTFTGNVQKLRGQIAFASMVDETGKIKRLLEKYKPTVQQFHLMRDEKLDALKG